MTIKLKILYSVNKISVKTSNTLDQNKVKCKCKKVRALVIILIIDRLDFDMLIVLRTSKFVFSIIIRQCG